MALFRGSVGGCLPSSRSIFIFAELLTRPAMALRGAASGDSEEDGLVFLPHASPVVEGLCICLYVALAAVALARMISSTASAARRRPDALKRQRTFQRLLFAFAVVRAASFLPESGLARGLLNRLALCVFFSLVLFQVLFWIDIANAKVSTRSRRIWNAFVVANALFYAIVIGLCVLRARENASPEAAARTPPEQLERARLWDLLPVLFIALGSLAASLGLLYSTCKTRRRVGRVLRQFAEQSLPKRLNDRVEAKLQRALRVTNVIMAVCSVLFLMRTILYLQRPFSHKECGDIRDPNLCILIGYGLPELVPCSLFLVLMWEVEPHLELTTRRKSSVNAVTVARATETTPLLLLDRPRNADLSIDVQVPGGPMGRRPPTRTQRPSPLSSALGGNVIAIARRRLRRVLEESFGMRSDDETSILSSSVPKRVQSSSDSPHSRSSSDRRDPLLSPSGESRSRESSLISRADQEALGGPFVWMSFQCFHLKLPSMTDTAVVLVLHEVDPTSGEPTTEFGRTEVAYSSDPYFHVMLPVQINESRSLRASVYAVIRPNALKDLNAQWLIGSSLLPLTAYLSKSNQGVKVVSGAASIHELRSPLSRTNASGELVVRCEAPLSHGDSVIDNDRLERITRAFVYQPNNVVAAGPITPNPAVASPCSKLLVEEELIESVYTWEMPYQLLQLILSDLLVQLDVLKRALMEPSDEDEVETVDVQTSASAAPTRTTSTPSVGMLSEMIMRIQGDAMERKSKKWGGELVIKMEKYINDVEAAILRYESANHGGLTFKPSTMKADSGLSFLALNLHQQLISVGNAVTASTSDLGAGNKRARVDAEHYVKLIDSSSAALDTASPSLRILEVEHGGIDFFEDSASELDEDEDMVSSPSSQRRSEDDTRSRTPEPYEALRRRVISFDSAENIVNLQAFGGGQSVPLSREQRQLAESIVALGIENAMDAEGSDEAEEEPDAPSPTSTTRDSVHSQGRGSTSRSHHSRATRETTASKTSSVSSQGRLSEGDPFSDHEMYGTTTVGAFAAHVYGFRKGGIRQLRGELKKISERMAKEEERVGSELTVEALEREYVELKWHIDRRLEVTFCQAMSALATCFQQTLYVHLHERAESSRLHFQSQPRVRGLQYLEQLADIGFVFSVESLLSTYSKEAGMLGDMEAAVRELERVRIKLRPVQSPRAAQFRVSVTSGPKGLTMELPVIVVPPEQFPTRTMHRILGQDAATGAVYMSLATSDEWTRARRVFRQPIVIVPVIFSQGMNEMQTVANTVGKDTLQREINNENLVVLEGYVDAYTAWWQCNILASGQATEETEHISRLETLRVQLRDHVHRAGRGKHMDILIVSSSIARLVGGGRVTCCKSAKDRTAMSVTLEEASLLVQAHGLRVTDRELFTALLRTYGVRRENARKNIGQAQYCFSALQNYLLPTDYQCPPGTGGGGHALS